jgi:hypothetical protein
MSSLEFSRLDGARRTGYYREYRDPNATGYNNDERERKFDSDPVLIVVCPNCNAHLARVESTAGIRYVCVSCGFEVKAQKAKHAGALELPYWDDKADDPDEIRVRAFVMKPFSEYYHRLRMLNRHGAFSTPNVG